MELQDPNLDVAIVKGYSTVEKGNTAGVSVCKAEALSSTRRCIEDCTGKMYQAVLAPPSSAFIWALTA